MTSSKSAALLLVAVVAMGCGAKTTTVPGLSPQGARIAVMEFKTDGATVNYHAPVEGLGLTIAENIASELREQGHAAEALPAGRKPDGEMIVTGRYTLIDGGSQAIRYFVGFGAGAARIGVEGDVASADRARTAHFATRRSSGWGIFGGSSPTLVQKCIRRVAGDIGTMVETGEYRTVQ